MGWDRESINAAYDALDAAYDTVAALTYDTLDIRNTLGYLDRLEHLRRRLPATEHQLLAHAQTHPIPTAIGPNNSPEPLREAANLLIYLLNQDGDAPYDEERRAQRRGITLGRQDADGNVPIHGNLTPETAAYVQALNAKLAAPGMCNPADENP